MKKLMMLTLMMCLIGISYGQDTIVTNGGEVIICEITLANGNNVFYNYFKKNNKSENTYMSLKDIEYYIMDNIKVLSSDVIPIYGGDTIRFDELSDVMKKGRCTVYVGSDGGIYNIGDRIKIGVPSSDKTFTFITEGNGFLLPITQLLALSSGTETEIKSMWIVGTKRSGFSVVFRSKGLTGLSNYSIRFENALSTGEVKGFGISSNDALTELKRCKDKLDLGLMSQEEFDKKREELRKFIK